MVFVLELYSLHPGNQLLPGHDVAPLLFDGKATDPNGNNMKPKHRDYRHTKILPTLTG